MYLEFFFFLVFPCFIIASDLYDKEQYIAIAIVERAITTETAFKNRNKEPTPKKAKKIKSENFTESYTEN